MQFHEMALVGSCLHNVANAFVDNHFADDILTQRPLMSAAVARVLHLSSNSEYGFM